MKQTSGKEMHTFESRTLQLQFESNISLPVFTGARIEGEDGSNLRVVLVDVLTGKAVSSGSESIARVEIVVLEGDFEDESEIWMPGEFRSNIVREREGKKPLLTRDVILYLNDGTSMVGKISFTDNSSWTRSRRFRLGAKVMDNFDGVRIREAKTESFFVMDLRGELCKKHPLFDEVWRLEKIGKDGAFHKRLSREKIYTVKEFLTLLNLDPAKLRSILGTGMSAKMWEMTVEHARTCTLETTRHIYFLSHSQQKTGVVFSAVGQVTGLLSGCEYAPVDKLSETEKADAQNLVISAIRQGEKFSSYEDEASLMDGSSHLTNVIYSSNSPNTEGSSANKLLAPQKTGGPLTHKQVPLLLISWHPFILLEDPVAWMTFACLILTACALRYDPNLGFPVQITNALICDTDPMAHAFDEDHLQFFLY